jgi:hypothetical protein
LRVHNHNHSINCWNIQHQSLPTPGNHIQYGFETYGPDANPATVVALEDVMIAPVLSPCRLSAAGMADFKILQQNAA